MKVESIAECSPWSFWPALSDNWSCKPFFGLFESGRFTQVWLYTKCRRQLITRFSMLFKTEYCEQRGIKVKNVFFSLYMSPVTITMDKECIQFASFSPLKRHVSQHSTWGVGTYSIVMQQCSVSPEPLLLVYTKYSCIRSLWPKFIPTVPSEIQWTSFFF